MLGVEDMQDINLEMDVNIVNNQGHTALCRRRGPKTPRTYAPPAVAVWSPFLVTLRDASASLQHLQASLHRQIQTTRTE